MKTNLLFTVSTAIAAGGAATAGANAQSLDYAMLQELFGEPVTAGATGAPQRASDVPATMEIITSEQIADYPELDIPGILRHFTGVEVNRYAAGQADVSIRGYSQPYQPRLLVLINGRQVYLDYYAYTNWAALPVQPSEIQQIEVIKGAQSALYGFNAVAGVINIITKDPAKGSFSGFDLEGGQHAYARASGAFGGQLTERLAVRGSIGFSRMDNHDTGPLGGDDPFTPGSEGFMRDADVERFQTAVAGSYQVTSKIRADAEVTYTSSNQPEMLPFYTYYGVDLETFSASGSLEADTEFGLLSGRLYQNRANYQFTVTGDEDTADQITNTVTVFQLQNLVKVGTNNVFRAGFEFRNNEMPSAATEGQGDLSYDVWSVSGMWDRKITDTISATVALRYDSLSLERDASPDPALFAFDQDDYDQSIEELSYNATLSWRPDRNTSVRLSAARGVQTPSLVEFGYVQNATVGGLPVAILGDPSLDPTLVDSYELALDRRLPGGVQFRSALFYSETSDYKGLFAAVPDLLPPAAPLPTFTWSNQGDSSIAGVEASLKGEWNGVRWGAGYTYQSVEDELTVNQGAFLYPVDFENATPEHIVNANLGYSWDRYSFDAFVNGVSDTIQPRQTTLGFLTAEEIDSHVSVSMRAAVQINDQVDVSLNVRDVGYGDGVRVHGGAKVPQQFWVALRARF